MDSSNDQINRPVYWLGILLIIIFGCHRYYKPVPVDTSNPEITGDVIVANAQKYMILRQGEKSYYLSHLKVDNVAMTLNADLMPVSSSHLQYIYAKPRKYKYKDSSQGKDKLEVLKEVHVYVKDTLNPYTSKTISLPFNQIEKIELIEHDKGRTTTSYVLGGIGITAGLVAVAVAIAALTSQNKDDEPAYTPPPSYDGTTYGGGSCPYVYGYDGKGYILQGELFAGAIEPKLERVDYLPMDIQPINGVYQIRISNELEEKEYINMAELLVCEHNTGVRLGFGPDGKAYQLANLVPVTSARLNDRRDVSMMVNKKDYMSCSFDDTLGQSSRNELTLTFPNQGKSKSGKLVLNLKNSYWMEYLLGEYTTSFGKKYDESLVKLNNEPLEKTVQWTYDQDIPLSISVSTKEGWKEVIKLNTVGPVMNREIVIPVELDKSATDQVTVRLTTGFLFWEIDYAAFDFTADRTVTPTILKPISAKDEKGNDVLSSLAGEDKNYLVQPMTGDYSILTYRFDPAVKAGTSYTAVLASKGYYELTRQYSGKPYTTLLKKLNEPGGMSAFSMEKYQSLFRAQSIVGGSTN
jgi:hypothetical protein